MNELRLRRKEQAHYQSDSFKTISAYGPNAAVIHYKPNNDTNAPIGRDSLLLLDSGGQYLDGTTDVTRTLHFGDEVDAFQREAYTRVLMGSVDLARTVFLKGTPDTRLDQVWVSTIKVSQGFRRGINKPKERHPLDFILDHLF